MTKAVVLEEFHLTIVAPNTSARDQAVMRKALNRPAFMSGLARTTRAFVRSRPGLGKARVVLSR